MIRCEPATGTYVLQGPYEEALKLLRTALQNEDLRVPLEMDLSGTLRQELGVALKPCRLLCVFCPFLFLQAAVTDASVGAFVPLHIVVADHGPQTLIHFISPASIQEAGLPLGLKNPVSRLLARILQVLGRIGTPQPGYQLYA